MFKARKIIFSLVIPAALFASVPVLARDIVVKAYPTFRDLEFELSGQNRVDVARASIRSRIPVGTPTTTARTVIRSAGAHCGALYEDGRTKCRFSSFEAVEDHLHDVVWTVGLDSQNGLVSHVDVARESIGS
jgi:hypothetical protein